MAAPWVASLDGTLVGRRPKLSSGQNGVCPTWVSLTASIPEPLARGAVARVKDTLVLGVTSAAWPGWDTSFQHDPGEDKGWMLLLPTDPPDAAVSDAAMLGQVLQEQAPASSCCHHCSLECHKETAGDGSRGISVFPVGCQSQAPAFCLSEVSRQWLGCSEHQVWAGHIFPCSVQQLFIKVLSVSNTERWEGDEVWGWAQMV